VVDGTCETALRPPIQSDFADWSELWSEYLAFYETSRSDEIHQMLFERLLSSDPIEFHAIVAERAGALVGLVHYVFHRHAWRRENTCYLQDFYVKPNMRGTGLGRRLIEAVYAAADANGTPSVYWMTQEFNAPARQLYDRVGRLTPFIRYDRPQ